ncbi:hypothetical protein LMG24238_01105 [Paraburkholderia sediminicola]|uniref:Activator of Hsp90 ATPase homologue 1/2-like C-terminal domain-containing protein n=1 Tax=Paraburkholderia sediminicola TaxID=458836 RepID=A0A6J5A6X2_9BURK|nr:SRPBCC domain-containing protein [Paraburkholderia sediminicola]CAB3650300.1 hypothetical protein LMG24238_01105 [Paraburkholderia sediminicola]
MNTNTKIPTDEAVISMSRIYEAPREVVWAATTEAKHVAQWWGGPGVTNPVCEMDLRPGGSWHHVMRFPDGTELRMEFVFIEVEKPRTLSWRNASKGNLHDAHPSAVITVTLNDLGERTAWEMVARFESIEDRDAAVAFGFNKPIEASSDRLVKYLETFKE